MIDADEPQDPNMKSPSYEGCKWGPWSEWTICSITCGSGLTKRNRIKVIPEQNGEKCIGEFSAEKTCNEQLCPGLLHAKLLSKIYDNCFYHIFVVVIIIKTYDEQI